MSKLDEPSTALSLPLTLYNHHVFICLNIIMCDCQSGYSKMQRDPYLILT